MNGNANHNGAILQLLYGFVASFVLLDGMLVVAAMLKVVASLEYFWEVRKLDSEVHEPKHWLRRLMTKNSDSEVDDPKLWLRRLMTQNSEGHNCPSLTLAVLYSRLKYTVCLNNIKVNWIQNTIQVVRIVEALLLGNWNV